MTLSRRIPLVLGRPHPCSYLEGPLATEAFVSPDYEIDAALFGNLIRLGFRRSGDLVYSPRCSDCAACLPARIHVPSFSANRSQRRTLRKNQALRVQILKPQFRPEHFALFIQYQKWRHPGGDMALMSAEDYVCFLGNPPADVTRFIEFSDAEGTPLLVIVADCLPDGFSAVYSFFAPEYAQNGLGTFAILSLIQFALKEALPHVYLGFWIEDSPKMAYKGRFSGLQVLMDQGWCARSGD